VSKAKYFFLPVLVQIERFVRCGSVKHRDVAFYCSGGNAERDGLLDTLNGFIQYREKYGSDIKLEIATFFNSSDPYHKKVKDIIDKYPSYFTYLGSLPTTEIPRKLMEAKVLMLTPHRNYLTRGFPTKLGEYLASGAPVICSSIQDLSEQIPSDIVYFVEPNSPTDICEVLKHLLSDKQVSTELGERARQWVTANYTMDSYRDCLIQFLGL
jgi:glycosyltransferase involved in cell wall biosynthesis